MKNDNRIARRVFIGMAIAVAVALELWLWFGRSAPAPAPVVGVNAGSVATQSKSNASEPLQVDSKAQAPRGAPGSTPRSPVSTEPTPSQDLRVRVADPAGEPVADVPLRLSPGANDKYPPDHADLRLLRTTDAEGYAVFPDARSVLSAANDPDHAESWTLAPEVPFENPPVVKLDRSKLELPLVICTIPFSGVIDVHVRELDGKDAKDGIRVELRLLREEDLASPLTPIHREISFVDTRAGLAHFPRVPLGRTWEAFAAGPGSSIRTRVRAAGPVKPRTHLPIELVLGADHPVVAFRAVDERGNPLTRAALEIRRTDGIFGRGDQMQSETDEMGRFTVDLESANGIRTQSVLLITCHATDGQNLLGRPTISKSLEPGLNEGGDVVLVPEPLLVEGVVQDLAGNPVADAAICVKAGHGGRLAAFGEYLDVLESSDAHGRFELHGRMTSPSFDLWSVKGDLRSTKMSAHEGQRGIVLTLSPFYTVSGRFLLDDGIQPYWIATDFVDKEHSSLRAADRSPDGSFKLLPIPAGEYDIAWSYDGTRIAELDKVEVRKDLDLGLIDLRGKLHRYQITLTGAPPSSKITGEIAWRPTGSQEKWKNSDFNFSGTRIALTAPASPVDVWVRPNPASPVDVWVRPNGYRGDILLGVVDRAEMPLVAPLHVRLDLRTSGQLPKFPYILFADLEQDGVGVGQRTSPQTFTDDSRSLTYDVSAPGKLRVSWHLEWHSDSKAIGGEVLQGQETEIQVADIPDEQVFPIELDGDELTQLTSKPPF
jgi:hypothetical protein